ncbi:hypothetical protein [Alteromonas sp. a30]|uniref:hypothetical protein n=1 Tax=Alteromonas sp. a30 TaxID=2730917 RepID=UPI00227F3B4C|nr:hypothetical protein [Alteromonas sp. a30]MCY7295752.1 hypothetical protein [Alteromonas sp. a30]
MIEVVITINNCLPFIFAFIFIVSTWYFKTFSSLMITASLFTLLEFSEFILDPVLWQLIHPDTYLFGVSIKQEVWGGAWVTLNTLTLVLIDKAHKTLNVAKSRETQIASSLLILTSVFILLRYVLGLASLPSYATSWYTYAMALTNLGMGLFLLWALIWNIVDVDIKVSFRRLPRG